MRIVAGVVGSLFVLVAATSLVAPVHASTDHKAQPCVTKKEYRQVKVDAKGEGMKGASWPHVKKLFGSKGSGLHGGEDGQVPASWKPCSNPKHGYVSITFNVNLTPYRAIYKQAKW